MTESPLPEPVLSRPIGVTENFFRSRTEVDFYRNFFATSTYSRSLTADLPLVYRALRKTVIDYHILVCNVFKSPEKGYCEIVPLQRVTWGDVVEFRPNAVLPHPPEEFLAEMAGKKYYDLYVQKPLFRLIFCGEHDLTVNFEHTLADGVGARLFHEAFLDALAYCDCEENILDYERLYGALPAAIDEKTVLFDFAQDVSLLRNSLPPPSEMCMQHFNLDYTNNDPEHYSKKSPENLTKWPGFFPATRDYTLAFKLVRFSPQELAQILAKCRENGVTITSYLLHAQAVAFQPLYGNHYILVTAALTLRRFLHPEKVEPEYRDIVEDKLYYKMGNFAHMGVPQIMGPALEFSWDAVKTINADLLLSTKNDKILNLLAPFINNSHDLDDNMEFFTQPLGKNKSDALKISNLGFVDFPVYQLAKKDPWTITDIVFAQFLAPAASEFVINVIGCKSSGLSLVLSYYNHRQNLDEYAEILRLVVIENSK